MLVPNLANRPHLTAAILFLDSDKDIHDTLNPSSNKSVHHKEIGLKNAPFETKHLKGLLTAEKSALITGHVKTLQAPSAPNKIVADIIEHTTLRQADVYVSHDHASLAIQLLQNHLLYFPKQSVTIWLFLLDLLAKENLEAIYEQTSMECKAYFNIRTPAFSNDEASSTQCLEDFPRLTDGLLKAWQTPAALDYLDDLIYNNRLEIRVGFEKSVLEEMVLLRSIAHSNKNMANVFNLDEIKWRLENEKKQS